MTRTCKHDQAKERDVATSDLEVPALGAPRLLPRLNFYRYTDGRVRMFVRGLLVAESIKGTSQEEALARKTELLLRNIEMQLDGRGGCGDQQAAGADESAAGSQDHGGVRQVSEASVRPAAPSSDRADQTSA